MKTTTATAMVMGALRTMQMLSARRKTLPMTTALLQTPVTTTAVPTITLTPTIRMMNDTHRQIALPDLRSAPFAGVRAHLSEAETTNDPLHAVVMVVVVVKANDAVGDYRWFDVTSCDEVATSDHDDDRDHALAVVVGVAEDNMFVDDREDSDVCSWRCDGWDHK
jgi:hypothetical protein